VVRGIDQGGKFVKGTAGRFSVSRSIKRRSELERPVRERDYDRGGSRDFWAAVGPSLVTVGGSIATALITRKPDFDVAALVAAVIAQRPAGGVSEELLKAIVLDRMRGGGEKSSEFLDAALKLAERINGAPAGEGEGVWSVIAQALKGIAPAAAAALASRQGSPSAMPPVTPGLRPAPAALPPRPIVQPSQPASSSHSPASNGGTARSTPTEPISAAPSASATSSQSLPGTDSGAATVELDASQRAMLAIATPWLRRQADNLVQWAQSDVDTRLVCDMLTGSLPKLFADHVSAEQFLEWLNRQDWWTQLVEFEPAIAPHQEWCAEVREELIEYFEEERDSATPNEKANGARNSVSTKTTAG
jgi:hypothetical protein